MVMKPINFEKIDGKRFITPDSPHERRVIITGFNNDWIWVFDGDLSEKNCFLFQFDWVNNEFDVRTVLKGAGTNGIVFPEHRNLKISTHWYSTPQLFIEYISNWIMDNKTYLYKDCDTGHYGSLI
jgi:hypothetical protein